MLTLPSQVFMATSSPKAVHRSVVDLVAMALFFNLAAAIRLSTVHVWFTSLVARHTLHLTERKITNPHTYHSLHITFSAHPQPRAHTTPLTTTGTSSSERRCLLKRPQKRISYDCLVGGFCYGLSEALRRWLMLADEGWTQHIACLLVSWTVHCCGMVTT